jgi:pyruvate,water dikinase
MGSSPDWLIDLSVLAPRDEPRVGAKAANLARLRRAGFRVADGFCIAAEAYDCFVREAKLDGVLRMALQRKPLEAMRWEELWDTALRIRAAFLGCPVPGELTEAIARALDHYAAPEGWAVRSSAPGEDSRTASFAGLHESVLPVFGNIAMFDAIRVVWASLWSDAALLYRRELGLDPAQSRMAVLIQPVISGGPSGVAFGCDPRTGDASRLMVEAVPARCRDLVDGAVDPDHWSIDKRTGDILDQRAGHRDGAHASGALLSPGQLGEIRKCLAEVESQFAWLPDIEWTWRAGELLLLQARPVTLHEASPEDKRPWYLSLKPSKVKLERLAKRVAGELIPELACECDRLAAEPLDLYEDTKLSGAIQERRAAVDRWKKVYSEDFIPFAHGVRQFGVYYNDLVRPENPFEFIELLGGENFLARQRDEAMWHIAGFLVGNAPLADTLGKALRIPETIGNDALREHLGRLAGGSQFMEAFEALCSGHLDLAHDDVRLSDRPEVILHTILELSRMTVSHTRPTSVTEREHHLFVVAGPERREEALTFLDLARLSWRLRDDDNILIGRLESQLIRAVKTGAERLRGAGRLTGAFQFSAERADRIAAALLDDTLAPIAWADPAPRDAGWDIGSPATRARQLVGQPAAPGLAAASARLIRGSEDLLKFRAGEVLVCDAVQPTMTHLVPLASAVVERRGGMLIHGAIIARELGIPCANGVDHAMREIRTGDWVTVDGYLGIVTLGKAEFDLELGERPRSANEADLLP